MYMYHFKPGIPIKLKGGGVIAIFSTNCYLFQIGIPGLIIAMDLM